MVLLIDNYDSFTFILKDYLEQLGLTINVFRNDEITANEVYELKPQAIVLSPGPKTPNDAGNLLAIIEKCWNEIPMLGICLGHQAIGQFFGATLSHAQAPMHGKTSEVFFEPHPVFNQIENPMTVMRYHSLIISEFENTNLKSIASTASGENMAVVHQQKKICGIQFHPESILTPKGLQLLRNWTVWCGLQIH